jgi:hypothetical protein
MTLDNGFCRDAVTFFSFYFPLITFLFSLLY